MNAVVVNIPHILCPHCGKGPISINHLHIGQRFGPWYCTNCGKAACGIRTRDGADVELLIRWRKEVAILLEYIYMTLD